MNSDGLVQDPRIVKPRVLKLIVAIVLRDVEPTVIHTNRFQGNFSVFKLGGVCEAIDQLVVGSINNVGIVEEDSFHI
jgi:hypothetical protein